MAEMRPAQCRFRTEPSTRSNAASLRLQTAKLGAMPHKAAHNPRLRTT